MAIPIIGDLISAVKDVVGEVIVDKDKRIEINYKLQELEDRANQRMHEQMLAQTEINKVEAANDSVFVAGWRPAVGWIGAIGLAYSFVLQPFMAFVSRVGFGYAGDFPVLQVDAIMWLMGGMLGFGGLRTFETVKGVERKTINTNTPASNQTVTIQGDAEVSVTPNPTTEVEPKHKRNIFDKISGTNRKPKVGKLS